MRRVVFVIHFLLLLDIASINDNHALSVNHQDTEASDTVDVDHGVIECALLQQSSGFQGIKIVDLYLLNLTVNLSLNSSGFHQPLLGQVIAEVIDWHGGSDTIPGITNTSHFDILLVIQEIRSLQQQMYTPHLCKVLEQSHDVVFVAYLGIEEQCC